MRVEIEKQVPQLLQKKVCETVKKQMYFKEYLINNTLQKQFDAMSKHGRIMVLYQKQEPIGFLSGFFIQNFFYNQKGVYTPEWASYLPKDTFSKVSLYKALYNEMRSEGYTHHVQSNMIDEIDSFFIDFAYACIIKDGAKLVQNMDSYLQLKRIKENDIEDYLLMCEEHEIYMSSSPIYVGDGFNKEEAEKQVKNNNELYYVIDHETKVGFTTLSETSKAGSELLKTTNSLAIKGTHILNKYQNMGYGKELIKAINHFAKNQQYKSIVTDFETYNMKAHLFWTKHFDIVMKSYIKYIGE